MRHRKIRPLARMFFSTAVICALLSVFVGADPGRLKLIAEASTDGQIPANVVSDLSHHTLRGGKRRIAFATSFGIFTANEDGSGVEQITFAFGWIDTQPAWSPDGSKIAFASNRDGRRDLDIYVVTADGSQVQRLTNSDKYESEPAWSPDGGQLAYVRGYDPTNEGVVNSDSCAGESTIYLMKADGSDQRALLPGVGYTDPAWSPAGGHIAFTAKGDDGVYSITVVELKSGDIKRLTESEDSESDPAWSPDGRKIAFARGLVVDSTQCGIMIGGFGEDESDGPSIYSINIDSTGETRLTATNFNVEPAWSPDGKSIAFVSIFSEIFRLRVVNLDTSVEVDITPPSVVSAWSPSWKFGKSDGRATP